MLDEAAVVGKLRCCQGLHMPTNWHCSLATVCFCTSIFYMYSSPRSHSPCSALYGTEATCSCSVSSNVPTMQIVNNDIT